jgi:hypothetical protein
MDSSIRPSSTVSGVAHLITTSTPESCEASLSTAFRYVSSGWPVAYFMATVICGIALVIGAVTHVSMPMLVGKDSSASVSPSKQAGKSQSQPVGQITGMVECRIAGQRPQAVHDANVLLGHRYVLDSGLMEITYTTGARVLLQGPVIYEVETENGGFLSFGKLTGKVETTNAKGFAIRTPTAIVTDLGTEFAVEVGKQGRTVSHVFRGMVNVQPVAENGKSLGKVTLLRVNDTVQVERTGNVPKVAAISASAVHYIREMPKETTKSLDLVDIVAGGNGFSGRRDRGIDATNGHPTDTNLGYMNGDGKYHRVDGLPFVDGVFIPYGKNGPVQIDSAGHTFSEFGSAKNVTANHIWAGGVIPTNPPYAIPTRIQNVDYARDGRGLLFLHSNKGITFDLNAIRKANQTYKLLRFRATAGNSEYVSEDNSVEYGDLWVFVDGQLRFQRKKLNYHCGAIPIDIAIGDRDRFLTLAVTDGGHSIEYHWIILGDPRLDLQCVPLPGVGRNPGTQSP